MSDVAFVTIAGFRRRMPNGSREFPADIVVATLASCPCRIRRTNRRGRRCGFSVAGTALALSHRTVDTVTDQRRARRTVRIMAANALKTRGGQTTLLMVGTCLRCIVACLAYVIGRRAQELRLRSRMWDMAGHAVTLGIGRVRFWMSG